MSFDSSCFYSGPSRTSAGIARAIMLVVPAHVDQLLHPHFDPSDVVTPRDVVARGLAASPGAAVGEADVRSGAWRVPYSSHG